MTAQTGQRSVVPGTPAVTSVARPTPGPQLVTTTGGPDSERQSTTCGQPVPRHATASPDRASGPRGQRARSLDAQQNTRTGLRPHTRWYIT